MVCEAGRWTHTKSDVGTISCTWDHTNEPCPMGCLVLAGGSEVVSNSQVMLYVSQPSQTKHSHQENDERSESRSDRGTIVVVVQWISVVYDFVRWSPKLPGEEEIEVQKPAKPLE